MKTVKTIALLAIVLSVVLVSGCAQQPAQNATGSAAPKASPVEIKSQEDAAKAVVETSKDVKKISDTLSGIDKALSGK